MAWSKKISSVFDCLLKRKLLVDVYPSGEKNFEKVRTILTKPTTIYAGFDATSDSLHIGNLAILMNLIYFQQQGHRVICVIGDATARIGDPSGHTNERAKISLPDINRNAEGIERDIKTIFNNVDQKPHEIDTVAPLILRNSAWYDKKNVIDFVSDVYRESRVGSLLHKTAIKTRLMSPSGLNMSELSYQIFQAYDWSYLYEQFDCRLQVGGSDQAGNIYTGHDYIKRVHKTSDTYGLLSPLILGPKGEKIGKSTSPKSPKLWLNPEKTSPKLMYDSLLKIPDSHIEQFLYIYSKYPDQLVESYIKDYLHNKQQDPRYCQKKLANHIVQTVHGESALEKVLSETNK